MTVLDPRDPILVKAVADMLDARTPQIKAQARLDHADELDQAGYHAAADYLRNNR